MQFEKDEYCPVARALQIIGDRWSLLIVRDAFDGIARFSDFQKNLNVARNILTDRLRKLVDLGILTLHPATDGTRYQEYHLSPQGLALFPMIVALRQWGENFLFEANEQHSKLLDKSTQQQLAPMLPSTRDGQAVDSAQTFVQKIP